MGVAVKAADGLAAGWRCEMEGRKGGKLSNQRKTFSSS